MSKAPVSVGLPVYNGERYLSQAIESILSQDFTDFELIISDNASTDSTWDICQEYARKDGRIRLHRNETNIGMLNNFRLVFRLSESPYFMWTSHDDILKQDYLGKCYHFLIEHPDYVLCCAHNTIIDDNGCEQYTSYLDFTLDAPDIPGRFAKCLRNMWLATAIYGLVRSDALRNAWAARDVYPFDWMLMLELCIKGKTHQLAEVLRYYRVVPRYVSLQEEIQGPFRAIFGDKGFKHLFPWLNFHIAILRVVADKSLPWRTKAHLYLVTFSELSISDMMFRNLIHLIKYCTYKHPKAYFLLRSVRHSAPVLLKRLRSVWM